MPENNRSGLILFLKMFKQNLIDFASNLKKEFLSRNELSQMTFYRTANNEEKKVVDGLIDSLPKHENGMEKEAVDGGMGHSRTYASSPFHNSDDKAA